MAGADAALRAGLKAASQVFARSMRQIARLRTRTTADAVNIKEGRGENLIRGGEPGGAWGWTPIVAAMFDDDLRHPLFGNKRHWYKQGHFPITAMTEDAAIDDATDAFADAFVPPFVKDYGFD